MPQTPRLIPSLEQVQELYLLIGGYRVLQAIRLVAALGIADLLSNGPETCEQLARTTETDPGALYRALRFLASVGLFEETCPRCFGLTGRGDRTADQCPQVAARNRAHASGRSKSAKAKYVE